MAIVAAQVLLDQGDREIDACGDAGGGRIPVRRGHEGIRFDRDVGMPCGKRSATAQWVVTRRGRAARVRANRNAPLQTEP